MLMVVFLMNVLFSMYSTDFLLFFSSWVEAKGLPLRVVVLTNFDLIYYFVAKKPRNLHFL